MKINNFFKSTLKLELIHIYRVVLDNLNAKLNRFTINTKHILLTKSWKIQT